MPLTADDLAAIDALIERRLGARIDAPLPHKLTIEQFAWCVQRSAYSIGERRRTDRKFRKHCEGVRRINIHPAALALYGVDSGLAAARLRQFVGRSPAQSAGTTAPQPA